MSATRHAVLIVGAGPTGLTLAAELKLAGVDVVVIERRLSQELEGLRASGLHSRTLEMFDQRGIAERFISQGQKHPAVLFRVPLSISDFPTRHNYVLGLSQQHIERTLADWAGELSVPIRRGVEVRGLTQNADGVDVVLSDGELLCAEYVVGCDGGRSLVRKAAAVEFPGWDATTSWLIAEAATTEEPQLGFHEDAIGIHAIGKAERPNRIRMVLTEQHAGSDGEPSLQDVRDLLIEVYGKDFGIHDATWISRFTDMSRQAAAYRKGRILLAGDAAHVHPPLGGQGLNIGVQDAMNLGWKLAQVVKEISPPTLLDTYQAERHPIAAQVLRNTMAHVALRRRDERSRALDQYVCELLRMDEPRRRIAGEVTGLDIHYDLGNDHPLVGRRIPDLNLVTSAGTTRLYTLLHDARPVLLSLGERNVDIGRWQDQVRMIEAKCVEDWKLPVIGKIAAPSAVLIRPDGYVAWAGNQGESELMDSVIYWFGKR